MKKEKPLVQALSPCVKQDFPGFSKTTALGMPRLFAFQEEDCRDWYRRAMNPVFKMIGEDRHFPIFRMSHGEYILLLGYQLRAEATPRDVLAFYYHKFKRTFHLEAAHRSGPTANGTWEIFTKRELKHARETFIRLLRPIAGEGLLAAAFQTNPGYIEYCQKMFQWFEDHDIPFNRENYIPFYCVYAAVFGPDRDRLFRNRNILFINYLPEEKKEKLKREMERLGAKSVQFISISAEKALFQKIDIEQVQRPVDLVLIGAGVGAVSMIDQCRPLKAVCVDAGFAIDALAMPEWRCRRAYCMPDDEFNKEIVRFPLWPKYA